LEAIIFVSMYAGNSGEEVFGPQRSLSRVWGFWNLSRSRQFSKEG